jgi:hypothetical protein
MSVVRPHKEVLYFVPITYPLHVSAPKGHLEMDYIFLTTTDLLFVLVVISCIYFLAFHHCRR